MQAQLDLQQNNFTNRCLVLLTGHGGMNYEAVINMNLLDYRLTFLCAPTHKIYVNFSNFFSIVASFNNDLKATLKHLHMSPTTHVAKRSNPSNPQSPDLMLKSLVLKETDFVLEHYLGSISYPKLLFLDANNGQNNYNFRKFRIQAGFYQKLSNLQVIVNEDALSKKALQQQAQNLNPQQQKLPQTIELNNSDFIQITNMTNIPVPLSHILYGLSKLRIVGYSDAGKLYLKGAYIEDPSTHNPPPSVQLMDRNNVMKSIQSTLSGSTVLTNSNYYEFTIPKDADIIWGACRDLMHPTIM